MMLEILNRSTCTEPTSQDVNPGFNPGFTPPFYITNVGGEPRGLAS
jgi:hypothetical protein